MMTYPVMKHLHELIDRYPSLADSRVVIQQAYEMLIDCFSTGGKLLIAGNGGSAADAEHMVGELMKGFEKARELPADEAQQLVQASPCLGPKLAQDLQRALPAIALDGHFALSTAFTNDKEPLLCFAQQVYGYGRPGDVFLGISTSGNSKNILYAAAAAKAREMKIIGLTGKQDSELSAIADLCIQAPAVRTCQVQEYHLPIYHCLCLMLEEYFFGEKMDLE